MITKNERSVLLTTHRFAFDALNHAHHWMLAHLEDWGAMGRGEAHLSVSRKQSDLLAYILSINDDFTRGGHITDWFWRVRFPDRLVINLLDKLKKKLQENESSTKSPNGVFLRF